MVDYTSTSIRGRDPDSDSRAYFQLSATNLALLASHPPIERAENEAKGLGVTEYEARGGERGECHVLASAALRIQTLKRVEVEEVRRASLLH